MGGIFLMTNDPIFDFDSSQVPQMQALENSYTNNDLEKEIKELFLHLFKSKIGEDTFNAFVLGAQHLGSYPLVQKSLNSDGIALLNPEMAEIATRYLYRTWKSGDVQKRGLHIVRMYLRLLFGLGAEVSQLQQPRNEPYPSGLEPFDPKIGVKDGYFLTSRVNLDIDLSYSGLPVKQLTNNIQSVLPAKFLPELRFANITTKFEHELLFINFGQFTFHFIGTGYLIQKYFNNPDQSKADFKFIDDYTRTSLLVGEGELSLERTKSLNSQSILNTAGNLMVKGYWKGIGYIESKNEDE